MLGGLFAFIVLQQSDAEVDAQADFGSGERWVQSVERRGEHLDCFGFPDLRESVTAPPGEMDVIEGEVRLSGFGVSCRQKCRGMVERSKRP